MELVLFDLVAEQAAGQGAGIDRHARELGEDEVDAEHLLVGEHESTVDDDDVVAILEDVHVLADLAHPAERDDTERLIRVGDGHRFLLLWVQKIVSWSTGGSLSGG